MKLKKLQIIVISIVLVIAAAIALPIIRGRALNRAEEKAAGTTNIATPDVDPSVWSEFRGLKFGADLPEENYAFQGDASQGRVTIYSKYHENDSIGDAYPVQIAYTFYKVGGKEKFYGVTIFASGVENFKHMLSAINAYYGPGRDVSEKAEAENKDVIGRFLWLTSETGGVSSGVLEYDVHDDSTTFSIRYSELDALRKAEDKEAAKSGADF